MIETIQGDCRERLAGMGPESVQCVVTSPPYWGLRDYKLPAVIWDRDGRDGRDCEHEWGNEKGKAGKVSHGQGGSTLSGGHESWGNREGGSQGQFCQLCGAWRGSLGLEPTPDCGRLLMEFRDDLTSKEREFVVGELRREGLL